MIIALGSENITLSAYENGSQDGDMYFSRNGGVSFRKVIPGTNYCRFLDEGAAIVCAPGYAPTNTLSYTLDEALTPFKTVQFSTQNLDVRLILSDPLSVGTTLMMVGFSSDNRFMIVSVDMGSLLPRTCTVQDFELWTPNDGRLNGRCVLGHTITYQRIKPGSQCQSTINGLVNVKNNCSCQQSDYECDFGYYYNENSRLCELLITTNAAAVESSSSGSTAPVCTSGYYSQPSGYRLVPGDTCDSTLPGAVDWSAPVQTPCPVDADLKHLATILGVTITVLVLIVLGFVGFIWWKRKAIYASYKKVSTNDEIGLTETGNGPVVAYDPGEDDAEVMDPPSDSNDSKSGKANTSAIQL